MHFSDLHFLARHGILWMFALTLAERLGLPLFVSPLLVASGALAAIGSMNAALLLAATTVACLAGDTLWFELGRWKGNAIFSSLCRVSFQPDSCVRRSEMALEKHTGLSLLWAKWIPGVSHLALPLAGASKMTRSRFHLYNAIGSVTWLVALLASIAVIVYRYWNRRKFLHSMRLARISPEELYRKVNAGEGPVIVDLRHPLDFLTTPRTLPGALRIAPAEVKKRLGELPAERDIVVYCTCPNEETAVKVARQLKELGLERVRPLAGGLAGWEKLGFPVDRIYGEDGRPLMLLDAQ
jgi:membrane protein DedA with SNARE-associated domain/rhodanese-related sulfurtransferase